MPKKEIPGKYLIELFPAFQPMKIKYKDIFDFKAFYESLHEWLLEHKWQDEEDTDDQPAPTDHWESYYGERIGQGGAREIWFIWRLKRKAEETPLTYYLDMNFHALAVTNTEVVRDGMKMKVNKGEVEMTIKPFIEQNYLQNLDGHPILKTFSALFQKRVYNKALEQRKKELYQEIYAFNNYIKQWFKLKRYLPYEESKNFFPSYAWPSHVKDK
jgi:hypothetical protein